MNVFIKCKYNVKLKMSLKGPKFRDTTNVISILIFATHWKTKVHPFIQKTLW